MILKHYFILALVVLLASCANTKIIENWVEDEATKTYSHLLIIGISDSQQTRQIYEKHFVAELSKLNIKATASFKLISSKQKMTRETVSKAIEGTQIDAVLVSYLVSSETLVRHHESPLSMGYSGDVESKQISDTLVSARGRNSNAEIITLKNDIYDAKTKSLIWSVQTRTVAPDSIDEVVTDVTSLLINQMLADNVIK